MACQVQEQDDLPAAGILLSAKVQQLSASLLQSALPAAGTAAAVQGLAGQASHLMQGLPATSCGSWKFEDADALLSMLTSTCPLLASGAAGTCSAKQAMEHNHHALQAKCLCYERLAELC